MLSFPSTTTKIVTTAPVPIFPGADLSPARILSVACPRKIVEIMWGRRLGRKGLHLTLGRGQASDMNQVGAAHERERRARRNESRADRTHGITLLSLGRHGFTASVLPGMRA
jgi:hypothetical protein